MDGSEDTGLHGAAAEGDDDDDNSSTSDFDGESTAMSMEDMTAHSAATAHSDESNDTSSSARLNQALRQAAREAGTRSIDGEDGEMSMEIADQEITGAFQPWIKKGQRQSFDWEDISARHDQENIQPPQQSTVNDIASDPITDDGDEDLSMEVTNAVGRILSKPVSRRQSTVRRKSISEETNYDEQTMELTNVVGGIAQPVSPAKSTGGESNANEDEEMTMEFTSVVGGVLSKISSNDAGDNVQAETTVQEFEPMEDDDVEEGMDMEITGAIGGILPPVQEQSEPEDDDQTMGMEVTTAIGRILPTESNTSAHEQGDGEGQLTTPQLGSSPFQAAVQPSPAKTPEGFHIATIASENGSPSLASVRSRRTRQSLRGASNTPTSTTPRMSPKKNSLTPPTHLTPQVAKPTTPGRTPTSSSRKSRSASPKKHAQPESAQKGKSPGRKSLFGNSVTGDSAPLFVLQPHGKRRSSGLGIDKEGLGSPKVAAMLDKRRSIGEEVPKFVPQEQRQQGVRFEDPVRLQEEVDREREEEEQREDGHIPPPQPNDRDPTASLKDMISSLTPKKNKLRGRKSLHIGAARGILGKRPAELDQDEDEDGDNTPKRLRGREASPVKSIRLPAPPTKDETVGRRSPSKSDTVAKVSTTPQRVPRRSTMNDAVEDAPDSSNASPTSEHLDKADAEEALPEFEPIQLQDFLNMTNIHFMELTTTKRRHTTAPDSASKRAARLSGEHSRSSAASFEDCVAAGFCTVPMLELYQHVRRFLLILTEAC